MTTIKVIKLGDRAATSILPEYCYRDVLAERLKGVCEVPTALGRCDVVTDAFAIEVKEAKSIKSAIGQALAYAAALKLKPAIAYYGEVGQEVLLLINSLGIELFDVSCLYFEKKPKRKQASLPSIPGYDEAKTRYDFDVTTLFDDLLSDDYHVKCLALKYQSGYSLDKLIKRCFDAGDIAALLELYTTHINPFFKLPEYDTARACEFYGIMHNTLKLLGRRSDGAVVALTKAAVLAYDNK